MKHILSEPITGNPVFAYCKLYRGDTLLAEKRMVYDANDSVQEICRRMNVKQTAKPDRLEVDIIKQW